MRGEMKAGAYRQLFGFLVSLIFMMGGDETLIHFLSEPMRPGGALEQGPDALVEPSAAMVRTLARWEGLLVNMPGSSTLAAVESMPRMHGRVARVGLVSLVGRQKAPLGGALRTLRQHRLPLLAPQHGGRLVRFGGRVVQHVEWVSGEIYGLEKKITVVNRA